MNDVKDESSWLADIDDVRDGMTNVARKLEIMMDFLALTSPSMSQDMTEIVIQLLNLVLKLTDAVKKHLIQQNEDAARCVALLEKCKVLIENKS